jgi:DNA polymerase III delta prime subunit
LLPHYAFAFSAVETTTKKTIARPLRNTCAIDRLVPVAREDIAGETLPSRAARVRG